MDKSKGASVLHAKHEDEHFVALSALRVLITQDSSGWFAQGLEIDYASSGETVEEVKSNFETGFLKTVHEHLRMFGGVKQLLTPAPPGVWSEFYRLSSDVMRQKYSCAQLHTVDSVKIPFDGITFITPKLNTEEAELAGA